VAEIFLCSDHHFNHANILTFLNDDGTFLRPGFADVNHMNEHLIARHNSVVKPEDKVYFLGDVCMSRDASILSRLNGKKRLILGNHDDVVKQRLWEHFQRIYAWRIFKEHDILLTHVPIHRESFRKVNYNVHGHTHARRVLTVVGQIDPAYHCVCVEQLDDYAPIHIEDLRRRLR
jgi:calcineurin-like phosphoesterase family protein